MEMCIACTSLDPNLLKIITNFDAKHSIMPTIYSLNSYIRSSPKYLPEEKIKLC